MNRKTFVKGLLVPFILLNNPIILNPKKENMKKNIAILIFNDAEVLDFAGPFEVFSVASQLQNFELFNVFTIAKTKNIVTAVNGLLVSPMYSFNDHPAIDILIISGGQGTRKVIEDKEILIWVKNTYEKSEITLSICSGARILGKLGLLDGKPYCTHQGVYEHMKEIVPTGKPHPEKRFIQSAENLFTSGRISAGIDLSVYILEKLQGSDISHATAEYMEYNLIK